LPKRLAHAVVATTPVTSLKRFHGSDADADDADHGGDVAGPRRLKKSCFGLLLAPPLPKQVKETSTYFGASEDPLQGAAMHLEPVRRLGDIAFAKLVDPLNVLPTHPVRRHRIFRRPSFSIAGRRD
jgi:hypothetical protein